MVHASDHLPFDDLLQSSSIPKHVNDHYDPSLLDDDGFYSSFCDSLLNFDALREAVEGFADSVVSENTPSEVSDKCLEMIKTENLETDGVLDRTISRVNHLVFKDVTVVEIDSSKESRINEKGEDGITCMVELDDDLCRDSFGEGVMVDDPGELKDIGGSLEGEMKQVSLSGVCNTTVVGVGDEEPESASSSSSSSASFSSTDEANSETDDNDDDGDDDDDENDDDDDDDDDDENDDDDYDDDVEVEGEEEEEEGITVGGDIEEGEMLGLKEAEPESWSASEEDIDDGAGGNSKSPIRSKNELEVLPFVPQVTVTLQPYHEVLPVGVILSMMGSQVIVEGVEKHNPLSEGSVLWITESRSPLGIVDEIFGPVKNPYYKVRFNSENEVPGEIREGTLVSFVSEFATYVLNNSDVYKKGYDASNENDEELSEDMEFSDDEKEAEYKKMLKNAKRNADEGIEKRRKNRKNKNRTCKSYVVASPAPDRTRIRARNSTAAPSVHGKGSNSAGKAQTRSFPPQVSQVNAGFSGGVLQNGVFPNGSPSNGVVVPNHLHQMPCLPNAAMPPPFQFLQHSGHQSDLPTASSEQVQPNPVPYLHGSFPQFLSNPNPSPSPNSSGFHGPVHYHHSSSNMSFPQFPSNPNPNPYQQQPCHNVPLPLFPSNPIPAVGMNFHCQNPYQQHPSPNVSLSQLPSNPNPNLNTAIGMNFHGQNPYQQHPSPNVPLSQFPSNPNPNLNTAIGMNFHGQNPYQQHPSPNVSMPQFPSNPNLNSTVGMNFRSQNPYQHHPSNPSPNNPNSTTVMNFHGQNSFLHHPAANISLPPYPPNPRMNFQGQNTSTSFPVPGNSQVDRLPSQQFNTASSNPKGK